MFASSQRFSLYDGSFGDFATALGFTDPVALAYILFAVWFLIGAAVVYLVAYRPRKRPDRAAEWAVPVVCGP